MDDAVLLQALTKTYSSGDDVVTALRGVDLSLPGEFHRRHGASARLGDQPCRCLGALLQPVGRGLRARIVDLVSLRE
jgi:hypothetical protein